MLKREMPSEIPRDFFINQRFLLTQLDYFMYRQQGSQSISNYYQLSELKRLKKLILEASCGQTFSKISHAWRMTSPIYPDNTQRGNYYNSLFGKNVPTKVVNDNNVREITDPLLLQLITQLESRYGEVKLYPEVLKKQFAHCLFNAENTINTVGALEIFDYAATIAAKAENQESGSVTADDNFIVLKELLEPLLYKKDLLDDVAFYHIYTNSYKWDASQDVNEMEDVNQFEDEEERYYYYHAQLNKCAQIQQTIINSLGGLRLLKSMDITSEPITNNVKASSFGPR